jgi:hypothetical protein
MELISNDKVRMTKGTAFRELNAGLIDINTGYILLAFTL